MKRRRERIFRKFIYVLRIIMIATVVIIPLYRIIDIKDNTPETETQMDTRLILSSAGASRAIRTPIVLFDDLIEDIFREQCDELFNNFVKIKEK